MPPGWERTGVLVVRAWIERGSGLRARITSTLDVSRRENRSAEAARTPEEIQAAVGRWLDAFLEDEERPEARDGGVT